MSPLLWFVYTGSAGARDGTVHRPTNFPRFRGSRHRIIWPRIIYLFLNLPLCRRLAKKSKCSLQVKGLFTCFNNYPFDVLQFDLWDSLCNGWQSCWELIHLSVTAVLIYLELIVRKSYSSYLIKNTAPNTTIRMMRTNTSPTIRPTLEDLVGRTAAATTTTKWKNDIKNVVI